MATTRTTRDLLDDILHALDAQEQTMITVSIESRRYGKAFTVIEGLEHRNDVKDILKALKQGLATGGSAKAGRIELQGDHRRRAIAILAEHGLLVVS